MAFYGVVFFFLSGVIYESDFVSIRTVPSVCRKTYGKGEGGVCRTSVAVMSHLSVGSEQSETTGRSATAVSVALFRGFLKITFYYITIIFNAQ